ncbi:imidazolonepropionase, partial [Candidatus Thorarchaeota archaeon]
MYPSEAISASTINAAHAIDRGRETGSIEAGKRADIIILDCPNPDFIAYRFGINLVHTVIADGEVVHTRLGP